MIFRRNLMSFTIIIILITLFTSCGSNSTYKNNNFKKQDIKIIKDNFEKYNLKKIMFLKNDYKKLYQGQKVVLEYIFFDKNDPNYYILTNKGLLKKFNLTEFQIIKKQNNIKKEKFTLNITAPKHSIIKIMNIKPKYKYGILLEKGKYHILVSKNGYEKYDKWIVLNKNKNIGIKLETKKRTLSGNIIWSNENNFNFNFKNIIRKNSYIFDNNIEYRNLKYSGTKSKNKFTIKEAKLSCSKKKYKINGIIFDNFRLPSSKEFQDLFNVGGYKHGRYFNKEYSYSYAWTNEKTKKQKIVVIGTDNGETNYVKNTQGSNRGIAAVCITTDISQNIENIAEELLKYNLKKSLILTLPKKPKKPILKKIVKGEFETTKIYNKRVKILKQKRKNEYDNILKKWNNDKKYLKEEYQVKQEQFNKNKNKNYIKFLEQAMHIKYGNPKIEDIIYNADKELFSITLKSTRSNYFKILKLPVKLKYAKKFKSLLTNKKFKPTIELQIINDKLVLKGIKELKNPSLIIEKSEYLKSYKIKNNKESIIKLNNFIVNYPTSSFVSSAKERILILEEKIILREKEEKLDLIKRRKEEKKRKEKAEKRKQKKQNSYYSRKYVGDKVCKDGITAIILSITITAYVENVNGNNIQLRISDTEGTTPHMNGVTLYRNTLIWDNYNSWYKCNY